MRRKYMFSERRLRGPRKIRTRLGPWPFVVFIVMIVVTAIVGRWMEQHYEDSLRARSPATVHTVKPDTQSTENRGI
jgi:hypothetical protein